MIHKIFDHNFFIQFQALNKEKFYSELETEVVNNSNEYSWSSKCRVSTTRLNLSKYIKFLQPNVDEFSKIIGKNFNYRVNDMWLNTYDYGSYQEIHDHVPADISCVFFPNTGEKFSEFYFRDRSSADLSYKLKQILNLYDLWTPSISSGDIIFFPSNMLHGVSCHLSSTLRKTVSCDIIIQ